MKYVYMYEKKNKIKMKRIVFSRMKILNEFSPRRTGSLDYDAKIYILLYKNRMCVHVCSFMTY